jgi:hypothetical protein
MNFNRPLDIESPETGHETGPARLPPAREDGLAGFRVSGLPSF